MLPKTAFDLAVRNIDAHGDTDIFPFPIENYVLRDKQDDVVKLLRQTYSYFDKCFGQHRPHHIRTLTPVGISGFRWATQQDPFWNAFLLGSTIALADQIEAARIPTKSQMVFSYRLKEPLDESLFRADITWRDFMLHSIQEAKSHKYVVLCDISDCYHRIAHHRLENALEQLPKHAPQSKYIENILTHFSSTNSYGVPVGGPAARILVELVLNLTDQILKSHGIKFCRYADDYHIFADSEDDAHSKLQFFSEKLIRNDGLTIQKSKTRIMSGQEFVIGQTALFSPDGGDDPEAAKLFALNLRYDPYSPHAAEDYEELRSELGKIDILGLLNRELAKSRVHGALTKKIISAIRHLPPSVKGNAVLTLVDNLKALYPLFPIVAITIKSSFQDLLTNHQREICANIREHIITKAYVLDNELHAAYAVRILAEMKSTENQDALVTLYNRFRSPLVRRDVILVMAKWQEYSFLSDQLNEYSGASPWERRAFIIASYAMGDAGAHWRSYNSAQFNPFEKILRDWAAEKSNRKGWVVPI
jgi:hypothetical protein